MEDDIWLDELSGDVLFVLLFSGGIQIYRGFKERSNFKSKLGLKQDKYQVYI